MPSTPAQIKASTTLDRHLAVTAGPGSGKTRVLVDRYLNIVEQENVGIENVVAITFTNKAASEMRERLRTEIDARVEETRKTRFESAWRERKRKLESAVITTIHGFCSRLLRENPVEAVVDPQFSTLDDYTASVLLDAAAQAAVTELVDDEDELGAQLVAAYGRATLVGHLISVYNTLRGLGISLAEAERSTDASMLSTADYVERLAEVDRLLAEGYAIVDRDVRPAGRAGASEKVSRFEKAWEAEKALLGLEPDTTRADVVSVALERVRAAAPDRRTPALKPWAESVRVIVGDKYDRGGGALELAYFDACARPFAPILFRTLGGLDALYSAEKRAAAALDYEDLQLKARDLLSTHAAVARRVRSRYRYYLVDEFQDTNNLQRDIIGLVTLGEPKANLFIVGDRKQSIYGFRGAEVEVFARAVEEIEREGGESVALATNFRSDPRLVDFFNGLFSRVMRAEPGDEPSEIDALGFVDYEAGEAHRPALDDGPAVEIMLDLPAPTADDEADETKSDERPREREARRIAARIAELVESGEPVVRDRTADDEAARRPARYADIAILFRAMSDVKTYERELRIARVPYYVVAGKGFYDRPETTDLLNLLEFVDNRSDELALAAVLRSPLFGVSDDSLLALRADRLVADSARRPAGDEARTLWEAVLAHRDTPYVALGQHTALEEAADTLGLLLEIRNRVPISGLLREALDRTEYEVVAASHDDGAQRLSNVDKLLTIARQFERGSLRLLRDFIEYVRDFRRLESREAEANLRSDHDAVAVLTVHKAKGLEFPIVVIPDLQREFSAVRSDVMFERGTGLAFKVPDGRGGLARTAMVAKIAERRSVRERFEAMRVLYVAATRAEDLLLLSGATDKRITLEGKPLRDGSSWLHWTATALAEVGDPYEPLSTVVSLGESSVRLIGPKIPMVSPTRVVTRAEEVEEAAAAADEVEAFRAVERVRRMLAKVAPAEGASRERFSATSLQSFVNCPRQFYYARLLRLPGTDPAGGRDAAERADGDGRLPASLRGLVIHRFCETYLTGDDVDARLRSALADVRAARGDTFADILVGIDEDAAVAGLRRLADNYVASPMRRRVDERLAAGDRLPDGSHEFVRSELAFTLKVEQGYVLGTIDKVLLTPLGAARLRATVVDFKTGAVPRDGGSLAEGIERAAAEHRLQMQVYTLAIRSLLPRVTIVEASLHFLAPGPGVEYDLPEEAIGEARARRDLDRALTEIGRGGYDPVMFEARPGRRCRSCAFANVCPEGAASLKRAEAETAD